ncbi:CusA/CzcA family heavy metal efflux RND transporter [Myxococcota bacterium]|nr:CusA/CzcA family heavy metal efflux RND transporter [Myxococcota bacterium]
MIPRIIEASVHNRAFVLLLAVLLGIAGLWAVRTTAVDAIPDLSDVQVIVYTEYPGQAPEVVEDQVTYPLSTAMLSVPHSKVVRGYSFFGYSLVYVIFEDGTDLYWARSRVLEYLSVAQGRLPDSATTQLGPDATGVGWVYMYSLSDASPRARVLRQKLDLDGDGQVGPAELPAPQATSSVHEGLPVYAAAQLDALLAVQEPVAGASPARFLEESRHHLLAAFDRDADRALSVDELSLAANFRGLDLAQLRSLQDWTIRYELMALDGVSEVASVGGFVRQYQVELDPEKMRALALDLDQVRMAIQAANVDTGGRMIEMAEHEYMVRGRGYLESIQDLEEVPVGLDPNSRTPVLLKQVARVQVGPEERRGLVDMNGQGEVVTGIVLMRVGANPRETIRQVQARLDEVHRSLPPGVEIHQSYDRSALIDRAVAALRSTLVEEMVVVTLVCMVFLLHARSALVAMVVLPMGVLTGFLMMRLLGIDANIMSLGGIAIAIGVMDDASVVLVENLHKHREREPDGDQVQLVIRAASEVGPALFWSLLVITVSFLPVFALQDQEGRLFAPLAWTKTLVMAACTVLSITLIPALMVWFVRGTIPSEARNPVTRALTRGYRPVVRGVLRHPWLTVAAAATLLVATIWPWRQLGSEFMPPLDEGDLLYMPTTPPGLSITKARELLQQTDRIIATHPQVAHVLGKIGRADTATDPAPLTMIETTILLTPRETWPAGKTVDDVVTELDAMVQLPGLTNAWTMPIKTRIDMLATGIKTPVGVKLLGDDLDELAATGEQVEAVLRQVEGTASVYAERVTGGLYVDVDVRRADAARYGLTVAAVMDVVGSAIGGMNVTETVEGLERYPVNLRYPRELRDDLSMLQRVAVPTPMGHAVPLSTVADVSVRNGPMGIMSENARRTAWIYVDLSDDDIGGYVARAREAVERQVRLPPGVTLRWSGQFEYMERAAQRMQVVVPITLALIFVFLYAHFRAVAPTLIVLGTLPLALVGGVWLMWALDFNSSVAVAVGFIALAGLAAETGVVMLVYLDEAVARFQAEGRLSTRADLVAAVSEGAVDRVRPKLMTVTTTIVGLLPLFWSQEAGAVVVRRIAAPMVGGLVSSTVLTLIVIPAVYLIWRARALRLNR